MGEQQAFLPPLAKSSHPTCAISPAMSTLKEITTEEEWNQHAASLPATTLQIISFHAPWAARKLIDKAYTLCNIRVIFDLIVTSPPNTVADTFQHART